MFWIAAAAVTALVLSASVMPYAIRKLIALNIVDRPDGERKLHGRVVPVSGGVVVCGAMVVGGLVGLPVAGLQFTLALLGASVLLTAAGFYDDVRGLRGRQKLLVQIVVAAVVVYGGDVWVRSFEVFNYRFELGLFGPVFAICWIVGTINAINLLDGADGLASIVGITLGAALIVLCLALGKITETVLPAALVGALAGFLYFNLPPARIFLGDAGSQLIGLVLGATAIQASLKGPTTLALTAIVAIWTVPIFDVGIAVLRRKLTGRSVYYPDRGHLHHRLIDRGLDGNWLLLIVGSLCAITATGAVISVSADNEVFALVGAGAVLCTLVFGQLFGHSECKQFVRRSASLAASMMPSSRRSRRNTRHLKEIHLRGSRNWQQLWGQFNAFADAQGLSSAKLIIHIPALDEDFSARWVNPHQPVYERVWRGELPIIGSFGVVGRMEVAGPVADVEGSRQMAQVIGDLYLFEREVLDLIEREVEHHAGPLRSTTAEQQAETTPEDPTHRTGNNKAPHLDQPTASSVSGYPEMPKTGQR